MLNLLVLCHKYVIPKLEIHVLSLIRPLTQLETLPQHLTDGLTSLRVLQVSEMVSDEPLASVVSRHLLRLLWREVPMSDDGDPVLILNYSEDAKRLDLKGAAYYYILMSKTPSTSWDSRLTPTQVRNLDYGRMGLIEKWQSIFDDWGTAHGHKTDMYLFPSTGKRQTWLHGVWAGLASGHFVPHDVVGKLEKVISMWKQVSVVSDPPLDLLEDLASTKTQLSTIFQGDLAVPAEMADRSAITGSMEA